MIGEHLVRALLAPHAGDPAAARRALKAAGLAPTGVASIAEDAVPGLAADPDWREALEANAGKAERLRRAADLAGIALAPLGGRVALPRTNLGPGWSSDVDVMLGEGALRDAEDALAAAGFADLNPLLARIGRATPGVRRWAAIEGGSVLGSVELCERLTDHGPPAAPAVARALPDPGGGLPRLTTEDDLRRRAAKIAAARTVPLRGALEVLALDAAGVTPPAERDVVVALRRCAELEQELSGPGRLTALADGTPAVRNRAWGVARAGAVRREARRRVRPRRLLVAFSGIDGAGKSTQAETLAANLLRVSVPARPVWARLGFSAGGLVVKAGRLGQRVLPAGSHSAQTARATGTAPTAGRPPLTRRGPVGWAWTMAVTLDYVRLARSEIRRSRDAVVVLDRALPDALVGLDEGYGGALDLRLHRKVIERLAPRPDLTLYLRLSGAASYARKQDLFALEVLEDHAQRYDALFARLPGVIQLDAERSVEELALEALRRVAGAA